MKLWSESWINGEPIPIRYAAGKPAADSAVEFSENLSPHLAWCEVPKGTKSFTLICHDFDVPSRGDDVNRDDREVPADLPRVDFFHWVMIDLPASLEQIAEGQFSRGFTPRGKPGPQVAGLVGARHGLNDYTGWFASNPEMAGNYFGYDGPFPPFNDSLIHHYVFTLYALDAKLDLPAGQTREQVENAMKGHILARGELVARYEP